MVAPIARWYLPVSIRCINAMNLAFDLSAVRRWAEFSGDFNPIHFDLAHARMAGMEQLIVHGMLALMPIKQALSERNMTMLDSSPSWIKFKAAFRHPVAHDRDHILAMRSNNGKTNFQLTSVADGSIEHFRGGFGPVEALPDDFPWMSPTAHCFDIAPEQLALFKQTYADVCAHWVALDAVVFSQFMRYGLPIVEKRVHHLLATGAGGMTASAMKEIDTNKVVVQTSHTVYIDAELDDSEGHLHWSMLPPVLLVNTRQVSGAVTLPVYRDDRLVMLVDIGLLAKVSQTSPSQ